MKIVLMLSLLLSGAAQAGTLNVWACYNSKIKADVVVDIIPGGPAKTRLIVKDVASNRVMDDVSVASNPVIQPMGKRILASYSGTTQMWWVNLTINSDVTDLGYKSTLSYSNDGNGKKYNLGCMRTRSGPPAGI